MVQAEAGVSLDRAVVAPNVREKDATAKSPNYHLITDDN